MHRNKESISMGPSTAAVTAPRFWNMTQTEDDAEITIYGEIVTRRPTNWFTGEPEEGMFTTPDGFMEDLVKVQSAKNITVRINSVGGDLYTAIGISNRLKELTGNTIAIIDGIAASAATVIAMGCDTIKAYSGSLFMVHEAMTMLMGSYNHKALVEVNKRLEAANQAAAETYNGKTKLGIEKIRSIMAKESWMTGKKAQEDGWIDEVIDGEDPDMSLSSDKEMLTVNGISMSVKCFSNLPESITVSQDPADPKIINSATPQPATLVPVGAAANKKTPHKEVQHMTLKELRQTEPELVAEIIATAQSEAKTQAIQDERARIQAIQQIAATVGDPEMVSEAMYGENACSAQELALKAMQKQAALGQQHITNQVQDFQQSGAATVTAAPNGGNPAPSGKKDGDEELTEEDAVAMITGTYQTKNK
ncbi:MAG: Clp protease ClpP [Lachnospiraceae bacterium]|nr:Clp protease ClpP [Lachnospiraceae bacterium]